MSTVAHQDLPGTENMGARQAANMDRWCTTSLSRSRDVWRVSMCASRSCKWRRKLLRRLPSQSLTCFCHLSPSNKSYFRENVKQRVGRRTRVEINHGDIGPQTRTEHDQIYPLDCQRDSKGKVGQGQHILSL